MSRKVTFVPRDPVENGCGIPYHIWTVSYYKYMLFVFIRVAFSTLFPPLVTLPINSVWFTLRDLSIELPPPYNYSSGSYTVVSTTMTTTAVVGVPAMAVITATTVAKNK